MKFMMTASVAVIWACAWLAGREASPQPQWHSEAFWWLAVGSLVAALLVDLIDAKEPKK